MRLAAVWSDILFLVLFSVPAVGGTGVWTSHGPSGAYIAAFAFQPGASQVVYAGVDDPSAVDSPAVFRSTNDGLSWKRLNAGGIAVALPHTQPTTGALFVRGVDDSLYRSNDRGITWEKIGIPPTLQGTILDYVLDPLNSNNIFAVLSAAGAGPPLTFWVSTDMGASWGERFSKLPQWGYAKLRIDPSNDKVLYIQAHLGLVYKTTDQGTSWHVSSNGLPAMQGGPGANFGSEVVSLIVDPANSQVLYTGRWDGIFKSTNGGGNWSSTGCRCHIRSIALDPHNSQVIYGVGSGDNYTNGGSYRHLGTEAWRSTDAGKTWVNLKLPRSSPNAWSYLDVAVNPQTGVVFVGTEDRGILRSGDGGRTWTVANSGLNGLTGGQLEAGLPPDKSVYAVGGGNNSSSPAVYITSDFGATWRFVQPLDSSFIYSFKIHPRYHNVIAGISDYLNAAGMVISTDGGKTWVTRRILSASNMAFDPKDPRIMYEFEAFGPGGLPRSTDMGVTWQTMPLHLQGQDNDLSSIGVARSDGTIYVGTTYHQVFRSTDRGQTWQNRSSGLEQTEGAVYSMVVDWRNSNIAYAVLGCPFGIYKTTDGGQSWNYRLGACLYDLILDPLNPKILYAVAGNWIGVSADGAQTWQDFSLKGLPPLRSTQTPNGIIFNDVAVNIQDGKRVVYLSTTRGVYTFTFD